MAEGAKLVPFPASGRSRDAGGGEAGPGSPPSIALQRVGLLMDTGGPAPRTPGSKLALA